MQIMFWRRRSCKSPKNQNMKILEISGTEFLQYPALMTEEGFFNRYEENLNPEWFWQEELPNVLEVAKELDLI